MKPTLNVLATALLLQCFACSSASDGDPPVSNPSAGAGGASAGQGGGSVGGTSAAGAPAGGSASQGGSTSSAGVGGVASAGGASGAAGAGASGAAGGGPADGAALYNANCLACHGAQGVGGKLGPELQHPVRDWSTWVVRNGLPGAAFPAPMLPIPTKELSDAQLVLIWDYLAQPPQPTTGQALYLDYCANCHGADGKGGPTARPIINELANVKPQARKGSKLGQFQQRRDYMPAYTTAQLSDAELNAIYTYVDSL